MAGYEIEFEPSVLKSLRKLTREQQVRILERIESLSENPRPPGTEKLEGYGGYRVRVGAYRIVFRVDDSESIVTITRVGHRRDVYRRL